MGEAVESTNVLIVRAGETVAEAMAREAREAAADPVEMVNGSALNAARADGCRCSYSMYDAVFFKRTRVAGCPVHADGQDAAPGGDCGHGVPGHLLCGACEPDVAAPFGERVEDGPVEGDGLSGTLAARGSRYGTFPANARISQALKQVMADSPNWLLLTDWQREALELDALKTSRILSGDPDYIDNWHDKAGYATLVEQELLRRAALAAPGGLSRWQADAAADDAESVA